MLISVKLSLCLLYNFEFWILDYKTKKWITEESREIKLFYEKYMRF